MMRVVSRWKQWRKCRSKNWVRIGHPIADTFKAAGEAFNCFLARGCWYTDIQLCIVCIRVTSETELRHNVKQFSSDTYSKNSSGPKTDPCDSSQQLPR